MRKKYTLITPVLNELNNLPDILKSIEEQEIKPTLWVIIDNGSTDGSINYLKNIENDNDWITLLEYEDKVKEYAVGWKYSRIIDFGFKWLKESRNIKNIDFLGILDADVFPEPNYYSELLKEFDNNNNLGISSGQCIHLDSGRQDGELKRAVRGNCRLWRRECFCDAGYIIGPSADALSGAKAELKGWDVYAIEKIYCRIRKMGAKIKYDYYGYSMYYRGVDPLVATIKSIRIFLNKGFRDALLFSRGYFMSSMKMEDRLRDKELKRFFWIAPYRRLKEIIYRSN